MKTIILESNRQIYSVDFDTSSQLYEVVNVTNTFPQPLIKTFKYQAHAYKFARTLKGVVINQKI
tara:strand:+ start:291 stop:482 length:192 start_codon:yes stop_codon:yes gene_type:complete